MKSLFDRSCGLHSGEKKHNTKQGQFHHVNKIYKMCCCDIGKVIVRTNKIQLCNETLNLTL